MKEIETITATIVVEIDIDVERPLNARYTIIRPDKIIGEATIKSFEAIPCKTKEEALKEMDTLISKAQWSLESSCRIEKLVESQLGIMEEEG